MKYRKKPVVIEAYQTDREMVIHTLEGDMLASVGDYVITGVSGEQYPCKPDIFAKTYEPAEMRMLEKESENICRAALQAYGAEAQTLMVFEEMAELQKALCKKARGAENVDSIAEEIADVRIMLDQMAILHNCAAAADQYKNSKLQRLKNRIADVERDVSDDETEQEKSGFRLPCAPGDTVYLVMELPCEECFWQRDCRKRDGGDGFDRACPLTTCDVYVETIEVGLDHEGEVALVINNDYAYPLRLAREAIHSTREAAVAALKELERGESK